MTSLQTAPVTWQGLGLRLARKAIRDQEAYCGNESGEVWIALDALGGAAPVVVLLAVLSRSGFDDPERILLEAVTDSSGGFSWYSVAAR